MSLEGKKVNEIEGNGLPRLTSPIGKWVYGGTAAFIATLVLGVVIGKSI